MSESRAIAVGWANATLAQVAEVHDDLREPVNSDERANRVGPYPYYGATGQVGCIDDYLMDGEYVLLGEDGAPFLDPTKPKAYIVSGKAWVNNHAHVLKGIDGLCINRFLLHALNHADYRGFANGTTRLKLTQGAMRHLPIRLPPVSEQHRIVAKIEELFSDLDAGVAALERVKANFKRYRASVLKAAVEGRLTAKWRKEHLNVEPASKLLERILIERRKKWEEDQLAKLSKAGHAAPNDWQKKYQEPLGPDIDKLPELPKGWCWASVDQLMSYLRNGWSLKPEQTPPGHRLLRINAVRPMNVDLAEVRFVNRPVSEVEKYFIQSGDLLFTRYNGSVDLLGVCGIVKQLDEPTLHPDKLIRVTTVMAHPLNAYVELAANIGISRRHMVSRTRTTAGQTGISGTDIREMPIPLCSIEEQKEIVHEVTRRLSMNDASEAEVRHAITRASRLRQSILKRAFEGKLVSQDPSDEAASRLLAKLRRSQECTAEAKPANHRMKRKRQNVKL